MQDNFRIPSHITNTTATNNTRIPNGRVPANTVQVDPTIVTANNQGTEAGSSQNETLLNANLNQSSVYAKFISQLQSNPEISLTLKKLLHETFASFAFDDELSLNSEFKEIMTKLAGEMKMTPDEMVDALKYQSDNQTKFSGDMFDAFREMMSAANGNKEFEDVLGRFLKSFNGYLSTSDTLKTVNQNLQSIMKHIPKTWSDKLDVFVKELVVVDTQAEVEKQLNASTADRKAYIAQRQSNAQGQQANVQGENRPVNAQGQQEQPTRQNPIVDGLASGTTTQDLEKNLAVLKNEIIPFMSDYIVKTNDLGKARDLVTMLINNVAKLNTSSMSDVSEKFTDLLSFLKFQFDMPDRDIRSIKEFFIERLNQPKEQEQESSKMYNLMAQLIEEGSTNAKQASTRAMYKDIASSLLMDNSVFMPLEHIILPLDYNGTFMFSEIWVDKDSTQKDGTRDPDNQTLKMFITFDIKGLGYFEATIWNTAGAVDFDLSYPLEFKENERDVRNSMTRIFEQNGLYLSKMEFAQGQPMKTMAQAFPNLKAFRRGVDVTI